MLHSHLRRVRHSSIYLSTFLGRSLNISHGGMTILTSDELNIWVSKCWFRLLNCIALFFFPPLWGDCLQSPCFRYQLSFFSLSLWCLHLLRRDNRADSCRMEVKGVLWGLSSVAKESSELILSFPVCLLLPPDFSDDYCVFSNLPADHNFYRKWP